MKRKNLFALLTAGMLLASGTGVHANVYSERQERIADALYHVELFKGTNLGYELGRELNRVEGITLLVRMLGKEEAAMSKTYSLPFTDVADWAKPYVGYAYENGITNGVSATKFGSTTTMTDYMFITLTLRALGYTDKGIAPQFVWNEPYVLANSTGLIASAAADTFFSRGDAIEVFWNALAQNNYEMAHNLRNAGVFTTAEWEDALDIYLNGKETLSTSGSSGSVVKKEETSGSDNSFDFDWEEWEDWLEEDIPKPSDKDNTTSDKNDTPTSGGNNTGNGDSGNNTSGGNTADTTTDNNDDGGNNTTEPSTPVTPETPVSPAEPSKVTYEDYIAMSGAEQQEFFMTFANPADFFTWFNDGKAAYDAAHPSIEIGGNGSINLGDLIGGNGG